VTILLPVPVPHVGEHGTLGETVRKQLRHTELVGPIVVGAGVTVAAVVVVVWPATVVAAVVVVVVVVVAVHGIKSYVILMSSVAAVHTVAGCTQLAGRPLIGLALTEIKNPF